MDVFHPVPKGMSEMTYWLGTDDQGRDILSGIFYGLRISLGVGVISNFFALLIGLVLGLVAGLFQREDRGPIMRIVDLQLSFPPILIALIFLAVLGRGMEKVILALIVTQWARYARIVYASASPSGKRNIWRRRSAWPYHSHGSFFDIYCPIAFPRLIVVGSVNVAFSIALEATLSFLGVGLPITKPSLGLLIANGYQYILSGLYWISFFPGVALLITVGSLNLVTDQLRDVLNPRLQR